MNKKIASLFASVGFDIDTTDLQKLDGHLKSIRGNTANLTRNLRATNTQLNTTSTRMRNLAKAAEAVTKFNNLGGKYVTLAVKVKDAEAALARFGRVLKLIEPRLDSTNFKLSTTIRSYLQLARAVRQANQELSRTPNRPPRPIPPLGGGRGNGGGGGSGGQGGGFGAGFLGGLASTVGRFTPTGMVGGTALTTAAVGTNEIRKAGQDQQRMENMLLFSTKSQEEYARSLKYVRDEAERLGLNSVELGKAFAQVNMSAREKMPETQRRKMFTEMSEYIMVTGAGQEDQKLIFKAVNQMFSLGRIMAEEMNQLTERGVPRQMIYDVAKEVYNVKTTADVLKLQEQGQLDPAKILPIVFEQFAKQARDTGAYDKMMGSSIVAQNKFMEQLRQMSDQIMDAGLDKAFAAFFNTLTAGLPHLLSFLKSLGWVAKGVGIVAKAIWGAVAATANWIGQNPIMTGILSTMLLAFAGLTASITGSTVALGGFAAMMKSMGKKSLFLVTLLAIWYLFKEYDKYLKGEDTWMTAFQRKITEMTIDVQLFRAELGLLWRQLKDGEIGNVLGSGVTKGVGTAILDEVIPPSWREGIRNLRDRNNQNKQEIERHRQGLGNSGIPYRTSTNNNPTKVEGFVQVGVNLKYPNGQVEKVMVNAPVKTFNTGGLMTT